MKVFVTFALCVGFTCAYVLESVPGTVDRIRQVEFDSNGNIYALGYIYDDAYDFANCTIYKFNPKRELVSSINLPYRIIIFEKLQVTQKGDVYMLFFEQVDDPQDHYDGEITSVIRSGSEAIEILDFAYDNLFYLDPYDNLYYTIQIGTDSSHYGIHILRPDSKTPILIKNLEDIRDSSDGGKAVDQEGNIYFTAYAKQLKETVLVLLTKEELQNDIPEAKPIRFMDPLSEYISQIVADDKNNIWVTERRESTSTGIIKKVTNETYEIIKIEEDRPALHLVAVKDRIWVGATSYEPKDGVSRDIYYITLDDKIVDVPELQNLTQNGSLNLKAVVDKDGTAYFSTPITFSPELGQVVIVSPGESKPVPVEFVPDTQTVVGQIAMDINEDVWVFRDSLDEHLLFLIKKGETTANAIQGFKDVCWSVNSNPVTHDIVFGCAHGLFLAVDRN